MKLYSISICNAKNQCRKNLCIVPELTDIDRRKCKIVLKHILVKLFFFFNRLFSKVLFFPTTPSFQMKRVPFSDNQHLYSSFWTWAPRVLLDTANKNMVNPIQPSSRLLKSPVHVTQGQQLTSFSLPLGIEISYSTHRSSYFNRGSRQTHGCFPWDPSVRATMHAGQSPQAESLWTSLASMSATWPELTAKLST